MSASRIDGRQRPWNKGLLVGQKKPLDQKHVWSIRVRLELARSKRDLAIFNLAIDSKRHSPQTVDEGKAFLTMIRSAWNDVHSPFWRALSSFFLPSASAEQFRWFSELHSTALTLRSGIADRAAVDKINVRARLSSITAPTLVLHSLRDKLVPFEQGRLIATSIPNARFVPLDSENHTLLASEPAWELLVGEIEAFLSSRDPA